MNRRITVALIAVLCLSALGCIAQERTDTLRFAFITDTHISAGSDRIGYLQDVVKDVNSTPGLEFAIFGGDITEFGADSEIREAKVLIDGLDIPYWISAGNHDAKWSESGCNTFKEVFGYENYTFVASDGVRFVGTNSGPNMRMAPALIPHETLVWLDSLTKTIPEDQPVIFINHYPQDTSVLNYFQVLDVLGRTNLQMVVSGHWHTNHAFTYDGGIRGVTCRSTDPNKERETGYTLFTVTPDSIIVQEKYVGKPALPEWFSVARNGKPRYKKLADGRKPDRIDGNHPNQAAEFYSLPDKFPWMDFSHNRDSRVNAEWRVQDGSDIGCGAVVDERGDYAVYADEAGLVTCLRMRNGRESWSVRLGGKIFSTPAVSDDKVVLGCCDGGIYCLNLRNGKQIWKVQCGKSVLGSPTVFDKIVYIGASDGIFRALRLKDGKEVWSYGDVDGFVECKPFVDKQQVVFGSWGNALYSLSTSRGTLQWKWETSGSRMYSPAAVWPVKSDGKIFIVTPERKYYAIDSKTGNTEFEGEGGRESIGLAADGKSFYVKTMSNGLMAVETKAPARRPRNKWFNRKAQFGYDIAPSPIACTDYLVFVPTDKGNIFCYDASNGKLLWRYKVSVALINSIVPLENNELLVSTMDGVVTLLDYKFDAPEQPKR
jgi:outer membrane protein assembly factor BamB